MAIPRSLDARRYYRCAEMRRLEANILIKAMQPTGAVYLSGYVVECMLKALVIETQPVRFRGRRLEELKRIGHNLTRLLELYRECGGSLPPADVVRALNLIEVWSSEIRYDPKEIKLATAGQFLAAVRQVFMWANERL